MGRAEAGSPLPGGPDPKVEHPGANTAALRGSPPPSPPAPSLSAVVTGGVDHVLELARKHLGLDIAFLTEFSAGKQLYRGLSGDYQSSGMELGQGPPLSNTYCRMMTAGELPNVVPDTRSHPAVRDLPITSTARIGAYVGVPIRLSDGTLYGSFCCIGHESTDLDDRDVRFLSLLSELLAERVEAERQLQAARHQIEEIIELNRLDIAFQPIVDVGTGQVVGVEGLARFGTAGPPDVVFNQAHAVGLGQQLERLALHRALEIAPLLAPHQYVAVNLSPAMATEWCCPQEQPGQIVLEITEHAAVVSYEQLRANLAAARERGVRLAIDDAGAGYASLHHIVELHPDVIKIDRSLIDQVSADRRRRSVVKALVAMAAEIGATVIAEGVEQAADLASARQLGIEAAQGYLLARPSTDRSEVHRWLHDATPLLPAGHTASPPEISAAPRPRLPPPARGGTRMSGPPRQER